MSLGRIKAKRKRLAFMLAGLAGLGIAAWLALDAFRENIVFFLSPSDLESRTVAPGRLVRLGGLVVQGSLAKGPNAAASFKLTDLKREVEVRYTGILPDLFREGQGVVVEGKLQPDGSLLASSVLAKHDEKYMPPEVAAALKKSGRWQEGKTP